MDRHALRLELTNDPLGRGYSLMSDAAAAASLNFEDRPKIVPLNERQLLEWSAADQRLLKLDDGLNHADADVHNICLGAITLLGQGNVQFDLSNPVHAGMVDFLVAATVLTAEDRAALLTAATTYISRAAEIDLTWVREGDVQRARVG